MATLVFFHAHPGDEAIITGATIARATAAGHRVVLAFATRGELGELPTDGLQPGETLASRREAETRTAVHPSEAVDGFGRPTRNARRPESRLIGLSARKGRSP